MNLRLRQNTPVEDTVDDMPPIATGAHQTTSAWSTKAATAGIVTCLLLGPVGAAVGTIALNQSAGQAAPGPVQMTDQSSERAMVGEYARRVVTTWLTATQESPEALLAMVKDAQLASLPEKAFIPTEPNVARIEDTGGVWSVTVAVTVTDAREQSTRRYFQVPITSTNGTLTALMLPTPVSPPPAEAGSASEYRTHVDPSSPVGQTVVQFLAAYIAGAGDVSRYMTPGQVVSALTPAPYTSVDLVELRSLENLDPAAAPTDGQQMRVVAVADATVTDSQNSLVAYALTLTARAGRWEITTIDPTPAISTPATTPAPDTAITGTSPIPTP